MLRIIGWFCVVMLSTTAVASAQDDYVQRMEASRAVAAEFARTLREHLVAAMKQGGPLNAIEVCNSIAPGIAADQSEKHGWRVARTSLRTRNPANAPDEWERAVLEHFELRRQAGEDMARIELGEVIERDGRAVFRYMKAIATGEPCLACHGGNLAPEVAAKIDSLYPDDQARGFALGDIRGAFTITQPMPDPLD